MIILRVHHYDHCNENITKANSAYTVNACDPVIPGVCQCDHHIQRQLYVAAFLKFLRFLHDPRPVLGFGIVRFDLAITNFL